MLKNIARSKARHLHCVNGFLRIQYPTAFPDFLLMKLDKDQTEEIIQSTQSNCQQSFLCIDIKIMLRIAILVLLLKFFIFHSHEK